MIFDDPQPDVICVVVPTARLQEGVQRKRMADQGCRAVVVAKGDKWWRDVLRMVRPGTVVKIQRAHLLADPAALRKRGGKYGDLVRRLGQITDKGGSVLDVDRGWISSKQSDLYAMLDAASISLQRGSREPTGGKRGRPSAAIKLEPWRQIIEAEWHSRKHTTNDAAVSRMIARGAPADLNGNLVWRAMREWTGTGSSGRKIGPKKP